jgi:hypothetical protein
VGDLRESDACQGEWGKSIFGEELGVGGFVTVPRRTVTNLGEEEEFVGMEDVGRMAVQVAVKDGGEFGDTHFVTGFFASFARRRVTGSFADVGPTAGEGPEAVLKFTNEENSALAEGGDSDIDFGSGVTGLLGEKVQDRSGAGEGSSGGTHLRGDFADFVVALNVELVLTIRETGLGDGLETARPSEPLRNGHGIILAQELTANSLQFVQMLLRD